MPAGAAFSFSKRVRWLLILICMSVRISRVPGVLGAKLCCALGDRTGMSETSFQTSIQAVRKWHALAERRRRHYVELYRSERWRRYFTEEAFLLRMRDVIQNAEHWARILERMTGARDEAKAA
jgi:hypothetical protein